MRYRDLISGSLRLLGVVGQGQTARGGEIVDGLNVLNEFIDSLNVAGTILWADKIKSFPAASLISSENIGQITDAYYTSNGIDYPLAIVDSSFMIGIPDKSISGTPAVLYSDNNYPNMMLGIYPAPSSGTISILYKAKLNAVSLDDTISIPPAFQRMLRYNLALSLAPEYGLEAPASVQRIALDSLDAVQKQGFVPPIMEFDIGPYCYNINADR